jgi:integrase
VPRANRGPHLYLPKRARGAAYWVIREFRGGRAVTVSTGETDRRDAEVVLARAVLAAEQPHLPPDPLIADVLAAFTKARKDAITGRSIARICAYVSGTAGMWRASEITQPYIDSYVATRRSAGYAANTIRTEIGYLRAAVRWAASYGLIPAPRPWRVHVTGTARDRWLTDAEVERLMAAADKLHVRTFLALALHTGARSSAILELRWSDVDLERGVVRYPAKVGGKRRASVPINETLREALQEAQAAAVSPYVVSWAGAPVGRIQSAWASLLRRAGVAHCTPHDLRRHAGARMLQNGVPIEVVSAVLGHSNTGVTQRVYARLMVEHLREAVRKLG